MKQHFSPRELAGALGVSESSIKRWADAGEIRIRRTAGGHRRIPAAEAAHFIRRSGHPLARPEMLGLTPQDRPAQADDAERLFALLREGREREAADWITALCLQG